MNAMRAQTLRGRAFRYTIGAVFAAVVTGLLFVVMFSLIATQDMALDQTDVVQVADVVLGKTEIEARLHAIKPDKPEEPEEPPPPMDTPQQSTFDVETHISVSFAPAADVNIGIGNLAVSDGEYLPIVKVAPIYPRRAQTRGLQGYCIVEYTVTRTGSTRDTKALDCKPKGIFDRASVKAAEKFKYKPRIIDGEPVEVTGVRNKFTYSLE